MKSRMSSRCSRQGASSRSSAWSATAVDRRSGERRVGRCAKAASVVPTREQPVGGVGRQRTSERGQRGDGRGRRRRAAERAVRLVGESTVAAAQARHAAGDPFGARVSGRDRLAQIGPRIHGQKASIDRPSRRTGARRVATVRRLVGVDARTERLANGVRAGVSRPRRPRAGQAAAMDEVERLAAAERPEPCARGRDVIGSERRCRRRRARRGLRGRWPWLRVDRHERVDRERRVVEIGDAVAIAEASRWPRAGVQEVGDEVGRLAEGPAGQPGHLQHLQPTAHGRVEGGASAEDGTASRLAACSWPADGPASPSAARATASCSRQ